MDFEHVAERACFSREIIAEDHETIFYLFHIVVCIALYLDLESLCDSLFTSILDFLMIFVGNVIALDVFNQSIFGEVELWIVGVLPYEQSTFGAECISDASAVDQDPHASLCVKRLVGPVFDEMAGQRR